MKWLNRKSEYVIVTGGRDCVLRIWKIHMDDSDENDIELCDELIQHENYITSLVVNQKATKFYSADWNGVLLEWIRKRSSKDNDMSPLYQMQRYFQIILFSLHLKIDVKNVFLFLVFRCIFNRKIKIFPTSILRIELHPKMNRLYVQCINDSLIYAIETASAIVIQTMKLLENDLKLINNRNIFKISPCGSFIFMNNSVDDQIECYRLSNEEKINQFRLPISLATRKYTITSLSYHPNMNLIACTIFGDSISSSLFMVCHGTDETLQTNRKVVNYGKDVDLERDLLTLEEWHNMRTNINKNHVSNTFSSILNRIDDLFFMAIQSPKQMNDFEQLKYIQSTIKNLQQTPESQTHEAYDSELSIHNVNENIVHSERKSNKNNEISSVSSNSKYSYRNSCASGSNENADKIRKIETKIKENSSEIDIKSNATSSCSHHTFVLRTLHEKDKKMQADEIVSVEHNNGTYSVSSNTSEQSNLTFEIYKEKV